MAKIEFTILGSSAGMPQADRVNSGYVLDPGGRLIQFDCGGGVSGAFRRAGFDPSTVKRIIVSHTHADHISDLPLFLQMIHLAGRMNNEHYSVEIFLPDEAFEIMQEYLNAAYLHAEKLAVEYKLLPIPEDGIIEFREVSILPIRNSHLAGNADFIAERNWKNRMQCYSYLIKVNEKSILYSADLGSEQDLFAYLGNLDLLVVESTHIDVEKLLKRAAEEQVGKIVLTHFEEDFDTGRAMMIADKLGIDNFIMARDGMRIEL